MKLFSQQLKEELKPFHLLTHPFYQAWQEGTLPVDQLQTYAKQYYKHVVAFPRYISAIHSQAEDVKARRMLLENLNEEEGLELTSHPDLWLQFAEGVGVKKEDVQQDVAADGVANLTSTFHSLARSSYAEGLAALYAYEYQVPEVATSKIEGLKEHYDVHSKEALMFFSVHETADIEHREDCEYLLDQLSADEQVLALESSKKAAKALWGFLSSIYDGPCVDHKVA